MFDEKLQKFLNTNEACLVGITRLQDIGVETLEQAFDKASDDDLIWAITRPSVMNQEQCRLFLIIVLSSIEDKLTNRRSKNILEKLRTNKVITNEDQDTARAAAWALRAASDAECDAARAASDASAAMVAMAASDARAASDAMAASAVRAVMAASDASDAWASRAAWAAQAKWVRENFKLCDLHIN